MTPEVFRAWTLRLLFLLIPVLFVSYLSYGQAAVTQAALTVTDNFSGFAGQTPLPANWSFQGTGTRGTTWNGTAQTSSTNGGWYGNNNISFMGTGTASNGNATWLLQNNTGGAITQFTLTFTAQLFKSGTASPNVKVYYQTAAASANPAQGALAQSFDSLSFNDATAGITTGVQLSQTVTGLSVPNGQYVFIRFIHDGGTNGDNLGWDDVSFTAVTNASSCAQPLNLTASSVANTAAGLSWQAPSGITHFEYALTTNATPPASGTDTAATAYQAVSLTAGTVYYFHLRSNCGSGNFSVWTTHSFITTGGSSAQVKLMSYNLLNYPGSTAATREPDYRIVMDAYQPDILVAQEISQPVGATSFLNNVLNFSSTTYSLGTFIDGPDSDNALYYKTNAFQFISNIPVSTALRDINRFTLRHIASGDTLIIFSAHLKASSGSANEALREAEVDSLRKVTNAFATGTYFIVCGDFNFYSAEAAYLKLLNNGNNLNGKFNDVVSMSGSWSSSGNAAYHTQSPRGGSFGGMDDRFDLILFSNAIISPGGFSVENGTYQAFGNDGQHYNLALSDPPYTTYPQTLVTALANVSDHIPVTVTLSNNHVLPVQLIGFGARKEHNGILLSWETGSEKNAASFYVERATGNGSFEQVAAIRAKGNSNTLQKYAFTDTDVQRETRYYRIRMEDLDGTIRYSARVTVAYEEPDQLRIFPNPVATELVIEGGGGCDLAYSSNIAFITSLGETIPCAAATTANGRITIDTSSLQPGIYLVKLSCGATIVTGRFIRQ